MSDCDIAVCGAGPVGLSFALLLHARGVRADRVILFDAKPLDPVLSDPRSIALSYGSKQILEEIGVWPVAADPIRQIHVSRRGHFGRTLIDCKEYGLPALGYVARYGTLVQALATRVAETGIAAVRPVQVVSIDESDAAVAIALSDSRVLAAHIAVQAEGGLFPAQAGKALRRDYDQTAIVAHVHVSAALPQRAFERFTEEGPLALLPQDDGYALVWCARPPHAAQLLELPDDAFLTALSGAFGSRLGRFVRVSRRAAFPLGLHAQSAGSARTAAIGNAAQTLHPVAGQGLNLGLRDAKVLAQMLAQETTPAALRDFASRRRADRSLTIRLTDSMARIFASAPDGALSQTLLGASLGVIDAVNPAKRFLAEQLMFGWR